MKLICFISFVLLTINALLTTAEYSFESIQQYETSLINVMNDDWIQSRASMEIAEGSTPECPIPCGNNSIEIWTDSVCSCQCEPGYFNNSGSCQEAKIFGGEMTLNVTYNENTAEEIAYNTTYEIFNGIPGFENVIITSVKPGSIVAECLYIFNSSSDATSETVSSTLSTACKNNSASVEEVDCPKSLKTVIDYSTPCTSSSWSSYCDSTTTTCNGTTDGNVTCSCKSYYSPTTSATSCIDAECTGNKFCNGHGNCSRTEEGEPVCVCKPQWSGTQCQEEAPYCLQDSECNSPFGNCNMNTFRCNCMWGFDGDYCYQPWKFALTIVGSGLGLIIIILIIVFACNSRKTKKSKKSKDDTSEDYVHPLEDLNDYSNYQPGMMRAQLPSHLYSSIETQAPANVAPTSTFKNEERRESDERGSYTNYGYASVDKTKRASSKYDSPSRATREYF